MKSSLSFDNGVAYLALTPEDHEERYLLAALKGFEAQNIGLLWNNQSEVGEPGLPRMHPSQCRGLVVRFKEEDHVARREAV